MLPRYFSFDDAPFAIIITLILRQISPALLIIFFFSRHAIFATLLIRLRHTFDYAAATIFSLSDDIFMPLICFRRLAAFSFC